MRQKGLEFMYNAFWCLGWDSKNLFHVGFGFHNHLSSITYPIHPCLPVEKKFRASVLQWWKWGVEGHMKSTIKRTEWTSALHKRVKRASAYLFNHFLANYGNLYIISSGFFLLKSRGIVKGLFTLQCILTLSLILLLFIPCVSAAGGPGIDLLGTQNIGLQMNLEDALGNFLTYACILFWYGGIVIFFLSYIFNLVRKDLEKREFKQRICYGEPMEGRNLWIDKFVCKTCRRKLVYMKYCAQLYCWNCNKYFHPPMLRKGGWGGRKKTTLKSA